MHLKFVKCKAKSKRLKLKEITLNKKDKFLRIFMIIIIELKRLIEVSLDIYEKKLRLFKVSYNKNNKENEQWFKKKIKHFNKI